MHFRTTCSVTTSVMTLALFCYPLTAAELFNWDFATSAPEATYAFAHAGQGHPSCFFSKEQSQDEDVFVSHDVVDGEAFALLDASAWFVESAACYSFVTWAYGMEYDLAARSEVFTSADLSEYSLSFDAWLAGTVDLSATVRVQFLGEANEAGNPTVYSALQNTDLAIGKDLGLLPLTSERLTFSFSLDDLTAVPKTDEFAPNFSEFQLLRIEIEAEGVSGALRSEKTEEIVGFDNDNQLLIDNVKLVAPFANVNPNCDPQTGGDLNGDGWVSFADFLVLSLNFGKSVDDHTVATVIVTVWWTSMTSFFCRRILGKYSVRSRCPNQWATAGLQHWLCCFFVPRGEQNAASKLTVDVGCRPIFRLRIATISLHK